jgi:multidrug efflux pump subunit AcrA (membrane-fusion protein)
VLPRRDLIDLGLGLGLSLTIALAWFFLPSVAVAQQQGPAPVVVAPVKSRSLDLTVTLVGTVQPLTRSTIASETDGLVVVYPVEEGQRLKKGQLIGQLRRVPLEIDLRAARSALEQARQELLELERGSRPEEIEEARAVWQRAEAEHANAQREADRRKDLYEQQVIAIEQYQIAATNATAAQERVLEARAIYERIKTGPRQERIDQAKAQVRAKEAAVESLEDKLARTAIAAPFSGIVVKEHTEVGQWLSQGDPVVELLDLSTVEVTVPVPERYVAQVSRGDITPLALDALPGSAFTGSVTRIVPQADAESRTFPVKVKVSNPQGLIKSGMFARVTFSVEKGRKALVVPKDALVNRGPVELLFVVEDGIVHQVAVKRGHSTQGWVAVEGPVKEGQLVVIRGNERLRDGMPVTILPPEKAGASSVDGTKEPS